MTSETWKEDEKGSNTKFEPAIESVPPSDLEPRQFTEEDEKKLVRKVTFHFSTRELLSEPPLTAGSPHHPGRNVFVPFVVSRSCQYWEQR